LKKISKALKNNPSLGKYGSIDMYLKEFSRDLRNYLPEGIAVGDIIRIKHPEMYPDINAVITSICHDTDDIMIIIEDGAKLRKNNLKNELGIIFKFSFKKIIPDENSVWLLKKISDELKNNPALTNDKEFLEKLAELNNLPYIPEAHKKYNLLPGCHKYGGDVIFYPTRERDAISKLLPQDEFIYPYHHSYAEIYANLDYCIEKYGTTNGEINKLGKRIAAYKIRVQKMNVKENWSVLRYIGNSTDELPISGWTHGRYYYMAIDESRNCHGIFDDEEYFAVSGRRRSLDSARWEIAEDPTGYAAGLLAADEE
jgi:hypothetical protein